MGKRKIGRIKNIECIQLLLDGGCELSLYKLHGSNYTEQMVFMYFALNVSMNSYYNTQIKVEECHPKQLYWD